MATEKNMLSDSQLSAEEAWKFVNENFKIKEVKIHPSMIPFLLPWGLSKDGELELRFFEFNHNSLSPFHAYEICNNITGNHLGLQGNLNEAVISNDIRFMGTVWDRVSWIKFITL